MVGAASNVTTLRVCAHITANIEMRTSYPTSSNGAVGDDKAKRAEKARQVLHLKKLVTTTMYFKVHSDIPSLVFKEALDARHKKAQVRLFTQL